MSRYAFGDLFNVGNGSFIDMAGFYLAQWIDYGVLGWDNGLETYFIQLDMGADDAPAWWFGTNFREITSPYAMRELIKRLFDEDSSAIEVNADFVHTLIKERNDYAMSEFHPSVVGEVLSSFASQDEAWSSGRLNADSFSQEYINKGCLHRNELGL